MKPGPKATFQFLARTENEAAVEVLVAGLDSEHEPTRYASLRALLERRNDVGHWAIFKRLGRFDETEREIIAERPARLVRIVAEVLKDSNPKAVERACATVDHFRLYDAVPSLISALVRENNPNAPVLARSVLKLTESFYAELCENEFRPNRRDMNGLRDRITLDLEDAVRKFHRHRQDEAVEALLMLAKQKNVTLRNILSRPDEASYESIVALLRTSEQGGVVRLLLGLLEDPKSPLIVAEVIGNRTDAKFISYLAQTVGTNPSRTVAESLERIRSIAWAVPGHPVFAELDDAAQEGTVQILVGSSLEREQVLAVLAYLGRHGNPGGRRAAVRALRDFDKPGVSQLIVDALGDSCPNVRAEAILQLRHRQILGAMSMLIRMVDDPAEEVRRALKTALPEFNFGQFLASFDDMAPEQRQVAGALVVKIDDECLTQILHQLNRPSPVWRRRTVLAALAMGMVSKIEQRVIELLADEDHIVRVAAATALADCKSVPSWEALRDAMLDRSYVVQEAAEGSLQQISAALMQHLSDRARSPEGEAEAASAAPAQEQHVASDPTAVSTEIVS
ncbi:MAG: HEAT repeat domain-containing protein [Thermoguttaceae bacterium]|jgi:HEAT repeat protein|nr:HEAT repeat domain-containing protein [Thermoguttaceae bacterium]